MKKFLAEKILIELIPEIHLAILIRVQLGKRSLWMRGFFCSFLFRRLATWRYIRHVRNVQNLSLYKNCWYLNISAIRNQKPYVKLSCQERHKNRSPKTHKRIPSSINWESHPKMAGLWWNTSMSKVAIGFTSDERETVEKAQARWSKCLT